MSGHSHFKTVAATKNANDAKKGRIFSKMARVITIAAKEKGGDIATNAQLKTAIEKAKEFNMPKENIERAIKKGTGELAGENLEEASFEGFGPAEVTIIMEAITDNKNRTLGEIKGILSQYGGKMAGEGAVKWMFERQGVITINSEGKSKEALGLSVIEAGAEDIKWSLSQSDRGSSIESGHDNILEVYTKPEELENIKKILEGKNLKIESSSLEWVAKEKITISDKDKEKIQKLFEALDENDAIQNIYSNLSER